MRDHCFICFERILPGETAPMGHPGNLTIGDVHLRCAKEVQSFMEESVPRFVWERDSDSDRM
jgi:hypothetical protein